MAAGQVAADQDQLDVDPAGLQTGHRVDEVPVPLALLEAGDAHDPQRAVALVGFGGAVREQVDVDTVVDHDPLLGPLAEELSQVLGAESRAREVELGRIDLVLQAVEAKTQIVGVPCERDRSDP